MRWLPFLLVFCSCATDSSPTLEGTWSIRQTPGAGDCGMVEANQGITFTLVDGAPTSGTYNVEYPPADGLYVQPIVFDPADETFHVTLAASFEVDANHVTTDVAELVFDGDAIRGGGEIRQRAEYLSHRRFAQSLEAKNYLTVDVPWLLAEVERLRAEREALERVASHACHHPDCSWLFNSLSCNCGLADAEFALARLRGGTP